MEPVDVATRYYAALTNDDLDGVTAVLDDGVVTHVPGATLEGSAATRAWMQAFFTAFPDIVHEHGVLDAQGDVVSTEVRVRGTHTGPLRSPDGELPATNKAIDLSARNVMRTDGDRIVALTITFDQRAFLAQLGIGANATA